MEKQTTKPEQIMAVLFLIIGALTVAEFIFIQGMFTAPLMMALSVIIGIVNVVFAVVKGKYMNTLFYALLTIALNMGYYVIVR